MGFSYLSETDVYICFVSLFLISLFCRTFKWFPVTSLRDDFFEIVEIVSL